MFSILAVSASTCSEKLVKMSALPCELRANNLGLDSADFWHFD